MSRGWKLSKRSWSVVRRQPELMVLPIISAVLTLIVAGIVFGAFDVVGQPNEARIIAAVVICAYPVAFISVFCNVAFYAMADATLSGRRIGLGEALRFAATRLRAIAAWSLVSTIVGVGLRALELIPGAGGLAVRIAEIIANAAWAIASYFVVPALAVEDIGVGAALKQSVSTVKAKWGESVTGAAVIGAVTGIAFVPVVLLGVIGVMVFDSNAPAGVALIAVAVVLFGVLLVFQTAVSQVFRLAVYRYATTGEAAGPFTTAELQSAFQPKKNRFR